MNYSSFLSYCYHIFQWYLSAFFTKTANSLWKCVYFDKLNPWNGAYGNKDSFFYITLYNFNKNLYIIFTKNCI